MSQKLRVKVSKDDNVFNAQYLVLLNGIMHLFPRQLETLIAIANKGGQVTTQIRKELIVELKFPTSDALNMVIHELKKKKALLTTEKRGILIINPNVQPRRTKSLIFEFYDED